MIIRTAQIWGLIGFGVGAYITYALIKKLLSKFIKKTDDEG